MFIPKKFSPFYFVFSNNHRILVQTIWQDSFLRKWTDQEWPLHAGECVPQSPDRLKLGFLLKWETQEFCSLLSCHHPVCPASTLQELRASQIAKRTLIPINKAGSPVAEIKNQKCWQNDGSKATFGGQNSHRVSCIFQHGDSEVLWDVLSCWWLVLL